MKTTLKILCYPVSVVMLAGLLSACDVMGPSEGEFVQACLEEGKRGFKKSAGGAHDEEICQCAAKEAKTSLSPDAYRAMILDMQGRKQEAREITSRMSDAEGMAFVGAALQIFGKCVAGMR